MGIWDELEPHRVRIEAALGGLLRAHTSDAPPAVVEAMGYSLLGGGKRLRPILCTLVCEAMGAPPERATCAAVAVEMVHTYSLIHDDLPAMDDDDLRRGRPTCHKKYGEALAILAGDGLLTLAFAVLVSGNRTRPVPDAVAELARGAGACGMVGGQALDLIADGKIAGPAPATVADLEAIHRRKTGALIRAAAMLGYYAAKELDPAWSPADMHDDTWAVCKYADALGLLFQVTDDLLDVESTEAATGKRVNKDAGRGKLTYPGLLGVEASRRKADELCAEAVAAAGWLTEHFKSTDGRPDAGRKLADLARWVVRRDR